MKKKIVPLVENVAESGAACLVMMVQGNVLALGLNHWAIASQTGIFAGTATVAAITLAKTENRLVIAAMLGTITAIVDYFVHPGMIGQSAATEAILTGIGSAVLSFVAGTVWSAWRARRRSAV